MIDEKTRERFWAKVRKTRGCWIWVAARFSNGYGHIRIKGKDCLAHRISWELHYGPIPAGLLVCHTCDRPACTRPDHLFLGTQSQNIQDAKAKGRLATGERNGSHTHPERVPRGDRHVWRRHPELIPRGEKRGNVKLTAAKVKNIRRRAAAGETLTSLAREYGVAPSLVCGVVKRKRWAHVA